MRMAIALCFIALPMLAKEEPVTQRLNEATTVFSDVMKTPDKGIPTDLLNRAQCVVIVPSLKHGGFIVWRQIRQRVHLLPQQGRQRLVGSRLDSD